MSRPSWSRLNADAKDRVGQVWMARADFSEDFCAHVVVERKSYDQFEVFGWRLVSLDGRQASLGVFESQFVAVEHGRRDEWVLERLS